MYLFDNKNLELVDINDRFVEIVFCDRDGMITAPMHPRRAQILYNRMMDAGVSACYYCDGNDNPQIQIPWSYTDASRTTVHFTGAENAQEGIAHA